MLREITIKNLFDQFNYSIKFKNTGITIITGPNGYGKSTILKIINTFANNDIFELCAYPFDVIHLITSGNKEIEIRKEGKYIYVNNTQMELYPKRFIENWKRRQGIPYIERIGPDAYIDMRFDKVLSRAEFKELLQQNNSDLENIDKLVAINMEQARRDKKEISNYKSLDKTLKDFRTDLGEVKFIKEQRLLKQKTIVDDSFYREKKITTTDAIEELPNKLKEEIRSTVLKYSEISSQLDSSYPSRLFEAKQDISQDEFVRTLGDIIERQEKIQKYKLLKDLTIKAPTTFNPEYSKALCVYLDDTIQKLAVFDDILSKLDVFVKIINDKLFFKAIEISSDEGITVVREDGNLLDLKKLSSGEQQIIVLYYELIFGIDNKVLLMIDEPEISLHVAWQRELLRDFEQIISLKNNNLHFIIATHSPQVINNNWNTIIDLGEQYDRK